MNLGRYRRRTLAGVTVPAPAALGLGLVRGITAGGPIG
jgi:hypothetical protein